MHFNTRYVAFRNKFYEVLGFTEIPERNGIIVTAKPKPAKKLVKAKASNTLTIDSNILNIDNDRLTLNNINLGGTIGPPLKPIGLDNRPSNNSSIDNINALLNSDSLVSSP
ncbi:hypothetical protein VD0001_g4575 [Verticillium dahliae]|nr:hypothetical protein VD0001_g4575 [Verticillium dahliae]